VGIFARWGMGLVGEVLGELDERDLDDCWRYDRKHPSQRLLEKARLRFIRSRRQEENNGGGRAQENKDRGLGGPPKLARRGEARQTQITPETPIILPVRRGSR